MKIDLAESIIEAAAEVHRQLKGPGLLETVYEAALSYELKLRGINNQRQLPIPVLYKGASIREPLYLDLLVENQIIIEIKASDKNLPYYQAQLLTHLRLLELPVGLLINFGKEYLQDGVAKILNNVMFDLNQIKS